MIEVIYIFKLIYIFKFIYEAPEILMRGKREEL
jgi:hypothetical protein